MVVAAVLFLIFFVLLVLEVPVAVCLGASASVVILIFQLAPPVVAAQQVFSAMDSYQLLAIPLFLVAGHLLGHSGLAPKLLDFILFTVGRLRGGVAVVTVVVSLFFAGISGSGPADVAALGTLLYPMLKDSGFPPARSAALIAAGGGIGIIVPPSIALIIYGLVSETSVSRLFLAGIVPGLLIAIALIAAVLLMAKECKPPVRLPQLSASMLFGAGLAMVAPVIILGGIYLGVCTPTESAAVAVIYVLLTDLLFYRKLWNFELVSDLLVRSGRSAAQILFIIACASLFSWVLHQAQVTERFAGWALSVTGNRVILLLVVNAFLLLAGCFIDAVSIIYVFVPIFLPVMKEIGIDPVHFGMILTVNVAIGQVTPPVGVNLFVASTFSKLEIAELSRAAVPFVLAELCALLIVTFVPAVSLAVPNWLQ